MSAGSVDGKGHSLFAVAHLDVAAVEPIRPILGSQQFRGCLWGLRIHVWCGRPFTDCLYLARIVLEFLVGGELPACLDRLRPVLFRFDGTPYGDVVSTVGVHVVGAEMQGVLQRFAAFCGYLGASAHGEVDALETILLHGPGHASEIPAAETDAAAASMRVGASPGHHGDEIVPVHMEAFRHRVSWFHSQFAHGNAFRLVCGFHGDVAILVRIHVDRHFPGLGFAEPEFLLVVMTCLDRSFGEVAGVSGIDAVVKVCERREVGSFCLLGVQRVIGFPVRTAGDLSRYSPKGCFPVRQVGADRLEIMSAVEAEHIRWGGLAVVDHAECGFPGRRDGR